MKPLINETRTAGKTLVDLEIVIVKVSYYYKQGNSLLQVSCCLSFYELKFFDIKIYL